MKTDPMDNKPDAAGIIHHGIITPGSEYFTGSRWVTVPEEFVGTHTNDHPFRFHLSLAREVKHYRKKKAPALLIGREAVRRVIVLQKTAGSYLWQLQRDSPLLSENGKTAWVDSVGDSDGVQTLHEDRAEAVKALHAKRKKAACYRWRLVRRTVIVRETVEPD